jgi:predicted AAA+ superfamily ATPase
MTIVNRQITDSIINNLDKYPILAITGPRQSGKTTLLRNILPDYRYISLEDKNLREFAADDPTGFLKRYNERVIFDEVQRVPEMFSYLQTFVDESRQMGQFILSGSQNFLLMERITQSLAGRVAIYKLLPFDNLELDQAKMLPHDWESCIIKGFYPAIYDRNLDHSEYYSNYLQTYINRDITNLTKIHDMKRFNNFIRLCAGRIGNLLNLSYLANECGISQPTAKSWLSILESSYIIFLLPPYFGNFSKRIVKSPKLYFYDTGLAAFLLGLRRKNDLHNQSLIGSLFENLIVADFFKKNYHQNQLKEFWFWRDSNGHEIDLLTFSGGEFDIFEIKSSQTVLSRMFVGLDHFDEISNGRVRSKTLIYGGNEKEDRTNYQIRSWQKTL